MHRQFFGLALLLAGCGDNGTTVTQPPPTSIVWSYQYSPGMPGGPNAYGAGGFSFVFPNTGAGEIHYLVKALGTPLTSVIAMNYTIDAPPFTTFTPHGDSCPSPDGGRVGLYFHSSNDPSMLNEFGRWWYADRLLLAGGTFSLSGLIAEQSKWTSVYGKRAIEYPVQWAQAIALVAEVGVTFGGACSAGHGVSVLAGTAAMAATSFGAN